MKHPSPLTIAHRLLAAVLLLLPPALQAAPVPTAVAGDIFLGVRSTASSRSYLVKLGLDTVFRNATAGSSFNVSGLGNIASDLAEEFGAQWFSSPDVSWGIFGERGTGFVSTYGSKQRPSLTQASAPYTAQDQGARSSTSSEIGGVLTQIGGYNGRQATANSTVATFQENNGAASSYAYQVGDSPSDFGSLSGWVSIEGRSASGISTTALDLYRFSGTASANSVTNIGSFTISSAGVIRFTAPSPAAPVDTDGDGFTDAQEVYAGTNPNSAASFFRVAEVTLTPSGRPRVLAATTANRNYVVQYTPDLATAWADIFPHSSGAGATPLDFIESDAVRLARGKGFYRVKIQ